MAAINLHGTTVIVIALLECINFLSMKVLIWLAKVESFLPELLCI